MKTCLNHLDLSLAKVEKTSNHLDLSLAKVEKTSNYLDVSLAKVAEMSCVLRTPCKKFNFRFSCKNIDYGSHWWIGDLVMVSN